MDNKNNVTNKNVNRSGFTPPPRPNMPQNKNNLESVTSQNTSADKAQSQNNKPSSKANNSRLKKVLLILGLSVAFVLIVTFSIMFAVSNARKNAPLQIPASASVSVVSVENKHFITATPVPEASFYVFEIKNANNEIETVSSKTHVAKVTGAFVVNQSYKLRYTVQKKGNDKTKSKSSEWYSYIAYASIATPNLVLGENDVLSWHKVNNADSYDLYYANQQSQTNISVKQISASDFPGDKIVFDPTLENLDYGQYEFSVVARSNNSTFLPSEVSNKVEVDYYLQLPQVQSASYNLVSKELTIKLSEETLQLNVDVKIKVAYPDGSFTFMPEPNEQTIIINVSDYNNLSFDAQQVIEISLTSAHPFVSQGKALKVTDFENWFNCLKHLVKVKVLKNKGLKTKNEIEMQIKWFY